MPRLSGSATFHKCFQKQSFDVDEGDDEDEEEEEEEEIDEQTDLTAKVNMIELMPHISGGLRHLPAQTMAIVGVTPSGLAYPNWHDDTTIASRSVFIAPKSLPVSRSTPDALVSACGMTGAHRVSLFIDEDVEEETSTAEYFSAEAAAASLEADREDKVEKG